jgi:ribonuclease D
MGITKLSTNTAVREYLADLEARGVSSIALDLEGEFNLHCYGEHLCLVQLFDGTREVLIDPVADGVHSAMKELFMKRDLLKIMYDSSSDSSLVHHVLNVRITSILDLRPAVALLEYEKSSLSAVLEAEFGHVGPAKKKFQQYNWMRRPLSEEAVTYAMNDVRMLFQLKDRLLQRLSRENLLDLYILKNLYVQKGPMKSLSAERWKKAKGFSRLPTERKVLFRELFEVREETARKANRPPNSVYSNRDLMDLVCASDPASVPVADRVSRSLPEQMRKELVYALNRTISHSRSAAQRGAKEQK